MRLQNNDKIVELSKVIAIWESKEAGRTLDTRLHLADGLHDMADAIKCMVEAFGDVKQMQLKRTRLEEIFAEAYVAMWLLKTKYSIDMAPDTFQKHIEDHCDFMIGQYAVGEEKQEEEEVDYSTMEF